MNSLSRRTASLWAAAGLISAVAGMAAPAAAAAAANYPERPVTLVVTYPPGGTVDVVARLIGPRLSAELGQPWCTPWVGRRPRRRPRRPRRRAWPS